MGSANFFSEAWENWLVALLTTKTSQHHMGNGRAEEEFVVCRKLAILLDNLGVNPRT